MPEASTGFLRRLRGVLLRGGGAGASSRLTLQQWRRSGLHLTPPGPFDEPPAEPVELDPAELPWELRGDTSA